MGALAAGNVADPLLRRDIAACPILAGLHEEAAAEGFVSPNNAQLAGVIAASQAQLRLPVRLALSSGLDANDTVWKVAA